jgi:dTDP-4-amino-4,6-dideoxygalactose transaminase
MQLPSDANATGRDVGTEELGLLEEVIASGVLNCTRGTQVKAFEEEFAVRFGAETCRAVTSGTAAVHAAIAAIDPEPGDEIITTPITDMGAIAPILYQQAIPIFADVDPVSLNITPASVESHITSRTKAIIATHLFGLPCEIDAIVEIARSRGIPVIEDCAQAFLATDNGRLVGTIGDIGSFSFQQGKHMTTGEGGAVITSNPEFARRMRLFSDKGWGYGDAQPDHYFLALNYRMTDLQGAVARAQLAKLDAVVERRRHAAARLTALLAETPGLTLPSDPPGGENTYWRYPLLVDRSVYPSGPDAIGAALARDGIQSAPRYVKKLAFECRVLAERRTYGRSQCPFSCRERNGDPPIVYRREDYPGAVEALDRVLVLPWNEFYTEEHVIFIADRVRAAVSGIAAR